MPTRPRKLPPITEEKAEKARAIFKAIEIVHHLATLIKDVCGFIDEHVLPPEKGDDDSHPPPSGSHPSRK